MLGRRLVGLAHRIAYAAATAFFVFDFSVLPIGVTEVPIGWLLAILNLPVALVGLILPCDQRGLDFPVGHCHDPNSTLFLNHMRLAIPVYVMLFYVPKLAGLLRKRRRTAGSQPGAATAATG